MSKLAIITTHPIQYHSPWFTLLSKEKGIEVKVFYTWSQRESNFYDKDFGRDVKWDIPLLEGYEYEFVENISKHPDGLHYSGVDCPTLNIIVENWGPSHVLVIGWNLKAHLSAMRYFKGKVPVWFKGDSTLLDETGNIKQLARRLVLTWVYRYVDKAFYVGSHNKAYFLKHGLSEPQLVYAPHAIENQRFFDSNGFYQTKADEIRFQLGIKKEDIVVLFCGKFERKKNPLLLIELFSQIDTQNLHLVFIGGGALEEEMKKESQNNRFIHILPFYNQSEMPIAYRIADIFCLPSKGPGETWGLAVNEAMACSRAIIVSNKVGSGIDLVKPNFNGLSFKTHEPNQLKEILKDLTKEKCQIFGENSQIIIKDFTFEKIVEAFATNLKFNVK